MRYNYHATQMTREKSCNLVSVNQHVDLALCFTQQENNREIIQAVARYYYIEATNSAEVAFVIKESKRGKGMTQTLLSEMINIARKRGVGQFVASVRNDNAPMLKVFKNAGFIKKRSDDYDEVNLFLTLQN